MRGQNLIVYQNLLTDHWVLPDGVLEPHERMFRSGARRVDLGDRVYDLVGDTAKMVNASDVSGLSPGDIGTIPARVLEYNEVVPPEPQESGPVPSI